MPHDLVVEPALNPVPCAAFSCESSENWSSMVRDSPHRSAIISAPMPWLGSTACSGL